MREGQSNFERLEASLKNHNTQLLCSIIAEKQRFVIVFPWTAVCYCFSMDSCLLLFFHGGFSLSKFVLLEGSAIYILNGSTMGRSAYLKMEDLGCWPAQQLTKQHRPEEL